MDAVVAYKPMPAKQATFKAGLATHVHRWFRLTPSFSPDLVRHMLGKLGSEAGELVLDPFARAGISLMEPRLEGLESHGFEITPLLHFVDRTSLDWRVSPSSITDSLQRVMAEFRQIDPEVSFETMEESGFLIPPIHNPTRWWNPEVLKQIVV